MKLLTWMHWLQDLNWGNGKIWGSGVVPHDNVEGCSTKSTVYQLAAWALTHEGDIVGLVTVRDIETGRPKLVTPPPVAGDYLHREQLEADEVLASKRR